MPGIYLYYLYIGEVRGTGKDPQSCLYRTWDWKGPRSKYYYCYNYYAALYKLACLRPMPPAAKTKTRAFEAVLT
jgi:hypothetical protein